MTERTSFKENGVLVSDSRLIAQGVRRARMTRPYRGLRHLRIVLIAIAIASGARVNGQGVQAIRGVAEETTVASTTISKDSVLIAVSARAAFYRSVLNAATTQRDATAFSVLARAEQAANEVIRNRDDPLVSHALHLPQSHGPQTALGRGCQPDRSLIWVTSMHV